MSESTTQAGRDLIALIVPVIDDMVVEIERQARADAQMRLDMEALSESGQRGYERGRSEAAQQVEALERIRRLQPAAVETMRKHGFVIDMDLSKPLDQLTEAERWQKLSFSFYADLCEAESIARHALDSADLTATPAPAAASGLEGLREALDEIAQMLPGSVPLPMTETEYLRSMLHECVRKARAALAAAPAASAPGETDLDAAHIRIHGDRPCPCPVWRGLHREPSTPATPEAGEGERE